jgi:hypothetical protein
MHDPEVFDRPFEFIPERYLKDGNIDPAVPDSEYAAFGHGRRYVLSNPLTLSCPKPDSLVIDRICPGRYFSNDAIFVLASSILATFDISPPKDEAGNPVHLELKFGNHPTAACVSNFMFLFPRTDRTYSTSSQLLPFECEIKLRAEREPLVV